MGTSGSERGGISMPEEVKGAPTRPPRQHRHAALAFSFAGQGSIVSNQCSVISDQEKKKDFI